MRDTSDHSRSMVGRPQPPWLRDLTLPMTLSSSPMTYLDGADDDGGVAAGQLEQPLAVAQHAAAGAGAEQKRGVGAQVLHTDMPAFSPSWTEASGGRSKVDLGGDGEDEVLAVGVAQAVQQLCNPQHWPR